MAEKMTKYSVHEGLKCGWSVGEVERHYHEFTIAFVSSECRLWNIFLMYSNLVYP